MKKLLVPYYVSRGVLCAAFSLLVFGLTWKALVLGGILFALFLVYVHSGWFAVDPANPLFPVRRDERAREAQRKALVAAIMAGIFVYVAVSALQSSISVAAAPLAISLAILVYFASQFLLLARA
jgi:formate/nitrite transporter FocA (FNT family)